jgi:hypothetical protein
VLATEVLTHNEAKSKIIVSKIQVLSKMSSKWKKRKITEELLLQDINLIKSKNYSDTRLFNNNCTNSIEMLNDTLISDSSSFADSSDGTGSFFYSDDENESLNEEIANFNTDNVGESNNASFFCSNLQVWALKHNITHTAIDNLLLILKPELNFSLPLSAKTLLNTPKKVNAIEKCGGDYVYFGMQNEITKQIKTQKEDSNNKLCFTGSDKSKFNIKLNIGIDGLPISKSSNKQFWPILGIVLNLSKKPFLIALYFGEKKPNNCNEFLEDFVNECVKLESSGITVDKIFYSFSLNCIIADAPARSFIKNIKNHNGYNSCENCECNGTWLGRVILNELNCKLRSDVSFRNMIDKKHHNGETILSKINIGLVTQVPCEYMHLICLGVVKKFLKTWVKGKIPHRLSGNQVKLMSDHLRVIRPYIPEEFNRKTRNLDQLADYKATEYRLFLLYTGVVVLKSKLSESKFKHFLMLHCGILILLTENASNQHWNSFASQLLKKFVIEVENLYEKEFLIYNVHNLIHLADFCLKFGPLDSFSAFPFENHMQFFKKVLRKRNKPLEQVIKRMGEMENVKILEQTKRIENVTFISKNKLKYKEFIVSCEKGNNCFLSTKNTIILIQCMNVEENIVKLEYRQFKKVEDIENYPIKSSQMLIYKVSLRYLSSQKTCSLDFIKRKCVLLPCDLTLQTFVTTPFTGAML